MKFEVSLYDVVKTVVEVEADDSDHAIDVASDFVAIMGNNLESDGSSRVLVDRAYVYTEDTNKWKVKAVADV